MKFKPEEITTIIEEQIKGFDIDVQQKEIGKVLQVGDGIARVYGLENVMSGELVVFSSGVSGVVLNLEEDNVGVVVLGNSSSIQEGHTVERTGRVMDVPVGEELLGRVVNPLGEPIDGVGIINSTKRRPIERIAPGVCDRKPVNEPLQTGIKCIDTMIHRERTKRTYYWR